MRNTSVRVVALGLVFLLLLAVAGVALTQLLRSASDDGAGAGGSDGRATLAPTPDPEPGSSEAPAADLTPFYGQTIDWELCRGGDFECAAVTMPVDYADPGGQTFELNLLKVPARQADERIGSLVVNPGGPGAPGTDYAAGAARAFRTPLRDRFDIVGFDPRGTGASDPVDCLTDAELDTFLAGDPDPDTPAEGAAFQESVERLFAGCATRSDALVGHVTTVEAARDMDILRSALGEATLTYFGASYGTKLGATYADLFPDRVGRLVLDGAVDLSLGSRDLALQQAGGFETALRAYVQHCLDEDDDCYLGDDLDEGLATVEDFIDQVDAEPLATDDPDRPLRVGNAFIGVIAPLYNRDYWPILDQSLHDALDGDGSLLLRVGDVWTSRNDDGTYGDNSSEAIYAINCLDDPFAIRADQVAAELPAFEAASPTFGDTFAWQLVSCAGIEVRATEADGQLDDQVDAAGAPPIVVVGTTRDPATPYQWAVALADQLASGVLVTRDGDGHTGYNSGNDCVDEAVEDYLVRGTVPDDGLDC